MLRLLPFLVLAICIYQAVKIAVNRKKKNKVSDDKFDITKPIENPELVKAIDDYYESNCEKNKDRLHYFLSHAKFLVIINNDELEVENVERNEYRIKKDSLIKFTTISDEAGNRYYPVFTDWKNLQQYTAVKADGLIMTSREVFKFAMADKDSKGIIVNPASSELLLENEDIKGLLYAVNSESAAAELCDLFRKSFSSIDGSMKPEDTLLAMGNLAGLFMFLSFGFNLKGIEAGTVYLSEQADEAGPKVLTDIKYKLMAYGYDPEKLTPDSEASKYESNLSYTDIIDDLQFPAMEIMKKYHIENENAVEICDRVIAFTIDQFARVIDVNKAFGIVIYGIVQGSKTVPFYKEEN